MYRENEHIPIEDRLYQEGVEKKKRQMELSRRNQDKEVFSFHPDIKESKAKLTGLRAAERPIYERWDEIQKQKEEYLTKLRQIAVQQNPDMTFKPKLNKISENLAFEIKYQEGNLNVPVT